MALRPRDNCDLHPEHIPRARYLGQGGTLGWFLLSAVPAASARQSAGWSRESALLSLRTPPSSVAARGRRPRLLQACGLGSTVQFEISSDVPTAVAGFVHAQEACD